MSEKKGLFGLLRGRSVKDKDSRDGSPPSRHSRQQHPREHDRISSPSQTPQYPVSRTFTAPPPCDDDVKSPYRRLKHPKTSRWPPAGLSRDDDLPEEAARKLIASGAPVFTGHRVPVTHASEDFYNCYAVATREGYGPDDRAIFYPAAFSACTFRLQGPGEARAPWETLEQPSLDFCYGDRPGTVTLNHWVSLSGHLKPSIDLVDPGVLPRNISLGSILDRLNYLQTGFEEDDEEMMYKNLYKRLLHDPDKRTKPHKGMEQQMTDLIVVLSGPQWTDFSKPENQVVAKFFLNPEYAGHGRYKAFFHQLLLSIELDLRIHSKHHDEWAKEKLLAQLPPRIVWDLALARKWQECMIVERLQTNNESEQIRFQFKQKKRQIKSLRRFIRLMTWPNLLNVDEVLKEKNVPSDPDVKPLEERSSDAMSFFTGVILPGVTLPFLIINSLIDCDDEAYDHLSALTHMHPNCGFQYKSSTYWTSTSIVGKVLAPTCHETGGWIGPARPTPDLQKIQIARLRQRRTKRYPRVSEVESMAIRSDPLGPASETYPVDEFKPVACDFDSLDIVRVERLTLKNVPPPPGFKAEPHRPQLFDAGLIFAIDGQSWPLSLAYDVSFICAYPCAKGPHPLFYDYVFRTVKSEEILSIQNWANPAGNTNASASGADSRSPDPLSPELLAQRPPTPAAPAAAGSQVPDEDDHEKVLVIECFGHMDNEVLARAWCAHWGLSAVVANVKKTCVACAIREAYAGCLNVVILVEDHQYLPDA